MFPALPVFASEPRIFKSPTHTGPLVHRADSRARAVAAGSHLGPSPRLHRIHFWRE